MDELVRCFNCGATNRIPAEKAQSGKAPVCGRCKQPLNDQPPHPIEVNDSTFAEVVEKSQLPVLVDMWAPWCGPCRMIAPVLEQMAGELAGRLRIAKLNIDENQRTADRFRIQSIPALIIFKDGHEVDRMIGAFPKQEMLRRLEEYI